MSEMDSSLLCVPPMFVTSPTSAGTRYNPVLNDSSHGLYHFSREAITPSEDASHGRRISPGAAQDMWGSTLISGGEACTFLLLQYGSMSWGIWKVEVSVCRPPANVFPQGVTQKGPDVAISAWSMQRQGGNRLYIATSLCCDGLLPVKKGAMKALGDPSIGTPDS